MKARAVHFAQSVHLHEAQRPDNTDYIHYKYYQHTDLSWSNQSPKMPEAIATSKRKFHKLLDSITAASNTLPARDNATTTSTPLTAREKMDLASERARKRLRHSTSSTSLSTSLGSSMNRPANSSTTSLSQTRRVPSRTSIANTDENKDLPNFAPWSQAQFLERLKTFRKVTYWHPKPAVIGEVHWAKRGWTCVDVNLVACRGGCERRVLVKLDRTGKVVKDAIAGSGSGAQGEEESEDEVDETELENALAERYKDEIVNGHAETCLWRKAGCKDDIYRLSLVRPVLWQPELRKRYSSLFDIAASIKDVTFKSLDRSSDPALLPVDRILESLPTEVLPIIELDHSTKARALDVALHGWSGASESHADILQCDACFQRIGLWMYQPGYKPSHTTTSDNEAEVVSVDLLDMHREHCPWRNARSQQATGSLEGLSACQILNRVVSTFAREAKRKSEDARSHTNAVPGAENAADDVQEVHVPKLSREEVERLDREREGKLRRLKRMFTIKRGTAAKLPSAS